MYEFSLDRLMRRLIEIAGYCGAGALLGLAGACSAPDQGAKAGGGQGQAFYAARARSAEFPTPDTGSDGRFRIEKNCLIFVTDEGLRFLPVFPADTRFASAPGEGAIAILKAREIHLDRSYSVKGGTSEYGLASPPPESCPATQFLIGGLL